MSTESTNAALQEISNLISEGQVDMADRLLDGLIAANPQNDVLLYQKMIVLAKLKRFDDAFATSLKISSGFKNQPKVTKQIISIMAVSKDISLTDATEAEICRILDHERTDARPIDTIIQTACYIRASRNLVAPDFIKACNETPLIHSVLRHHGVAQPDLELACTNLRREMLHLGALDTKAFTGTSALALSLALQGHRNEFAFYVEDDEAIVLEQLNAELKSLLSSPLSSIERIIAILLIILMYQPPRSLEHLGAIDRPEIGVRNPRLSEFIEMDLTENKSLQKYSKEFKSDSDFSDETSQTVAGMYMQNPYPRWVQPDWESNMQGVSYPDLLRLHDSPSWRNDTGLKFDNMLVAGCGTGWHPITHAISFPWMSITAFDLSAESLAYAKMMAERLGIRNIQFQRADILEIDDWDKDFDIVESVGVLHHLERPEQGLQSLLRRLKPGGVFKFGLYSRIAREAIIQFRSDYSGDRTDVSNADIRKLRHKILVDDEFAEYRDVTEFRDFFTISGCRDLLLHPQESQYDVPELQALLAKYSLEFLTFSPDDIYKFQQLGGTKSPHQLANWGVLEDKLPTLFRGMYQFTTQYNGPSR